MKRVTLLLGVGLLLGTAVGLFVLRNHREVLQASAYFGMSGGALAAMLGAWMNHRDEMRGSK